MTSLHQPFSPMRPRLARDRPVPLTGWKDSRGQDRWLCPAQTRHPYINGRLVEVWLSHQSTPQTREDDFIQGNRLSSQVPEPIEVHPSAPPGSPSDVPSLGTQHPREGQVPSLDPSVQGFCYSIVLPAKDEITHTPLNRGCQVT